jgi:hypothetical protein
MKTFRVVTTETLETVYLVEAANEDEAGEMALAGDGEVLYTDTSNLEISEVTEVPEEEGD